MRCAGAFGIVLSVACEPAPPPPPVVLHLDGDSVVLEPGAIVVDIAVGSADGDFAPDSATAIAGDVIRIRSENAGPHAVGFDVTASDTSATRFLISTDQIRALPLLEPDAQWMVSLAGAPVGRYVLICMTHGARAEVRVSDTRTGRRR